MHITFVKKVLASGAPCAKCREVEARLERTGLLSRIDRIVVADERDESSEGMRIARRHGVDLAPFFVVENATKTDVYTVYLKFVREVLGGENPGSEKAPSERARSDLEEAQELLRANPDLDLI